MIDYKCPTKCLALIGVAVFTTIFAVPLLALETRASAVEVSSRNLRQGDTFEVVLTEAGSSAPEGSASGHTTSLADSSLTFNGNTYKFFPVTQAKTAAEASQGQSTKQDLPRYSALLAVPADLDPGKYSLNVDGENIMLTVRAGLFPLQYIRLAPGKDNFDTSKGEEEAVDNAKATISPTRLWTGPFKAPSKARTSTGFGLKRMVNGRLLKDYFHSGLDFAGGLGSPITACAGGKVILVGRGFKLHGNTVAIDHGQGVVSFYIHMQTIKVKEGEMVKAGQPIGTVGQTGRATGPHLHFSIYVNKVAANPANWFATAF